MIEGTKQMSISFLKKVYWNIVDLQYCVSFWYTAQWISYTYTYLSLSSRQVVADSLQPHGL